MFRAMADYGAPRPVDPAWYKPDAWLRIECRCGRRECIKVSVFVEYHRIDKRTKLYRIVERLRCLKCRQRPRAEVTRNPTGNR